MIEDCFKTLRKNFRHNGKYIIDHVKRNHFEPGVGAAEGDICVFCGSDYKLTKEHVFPKWTFQNEEDPYFLTRINESKQHKSKTTIPACSSCNNNILAEIEKYVAFLISKTDFTSNYFQYNETLNIIRWLEIIEYKFHILEFRRKFKRMKTGEFIPILGDIPMTVMRQDIGLSPYKALAQLRSAQKRVLRMEKDSRYFSLVMFKSSNKSHSFFHKMDDYIFFEFPQFKKAMFYFFNKKHKSNYQAAKQARKLMKLALL